MISICTCSHSIELHGVAGCGGKCEVCTCHCFRGARRIPRSCRYPLRTSVNSPSDYYDVALVLGGVDNTVRELLAEEKAS